MPYKRDDAWLHARLDTIWDNFFSDVPQDNDVRIVWGRKAKNRLGSIRLDPKQPDVTIITINRLMQNEVVPEYVIEATIVHELSHYAHGFNSPLEQSKRHPHAGGVMRREFEERGLLEMYQQQKLWLKNNWQSIISNNFPINNTRYARMGKSSKTVYKISVPKWFR